MDKLVTQNVKTHKWITQFPISNEQHGPHEKTRVNSGAPEG
jgi:hypothetical protein